MDRQQGTKKTDRQKDRAQTLRESQKIQTCWSGNFSCVVQLRAAWLLALLSVVWMVPHKCLVPESRI